MSKIIKLLLSQFFILFYVTLKSYLQLMFHQHHSPMDGVIDGSVNKTLNRRSLFGACTVFS